MSVAWCAATVGCAQSEVGSEVVPRRPCLRLSGSHVRALGCTQVNLDSVDGLGKRKARSASRKFALGQRAEMRARLVQLAIENKLRYGQAKLAGSAASVAVALDDSDSDSDSVLEML